MRRYLLLFVFLLTGQLVVAQDKQLPAPRTEGGMPLMEALKNRKSVREMSAKMLSDQQLADLLWAANGVNRPDGRRTAPSAMNWREIEIYVYTAGAVWLYPPEQNSLRHVLNGDFRAEAVMQDFAKEAPVLLVFVSNYEKMARMNEQQRSFFEATDVGYVSQNVYLYCTQEGLNTVVMAYIRQDDIKKRLGFNGRALLAQAVGYAK
jgi:SagB-type dehydrogenase family enzyme